MSYPEEFYDGDHNELGGSDWRDGSGELCADKESVVQEKETFVTQEDATLHRNLSSQQNQILGWMSSIPPLVQSLHPEIHAVNVEERELCADAESMVQDKETSVAQEDATIDWNLLSQENQTLFTEWVMNPSSIPPPVESVHHEIHSVEVEEGETCPVRLDVKGKQLVKNKEMALLVELKKEKEWPWQDIIQRLQKEFGRSYNKACLKRRYWEHQNSTNDYRNRMCSSLEEKELLVKLVREENMPWEDVKERLQTEFGKSYRSDTLQKQYASYCRLSVVRPKTKTKTRQPFFSAVEKELLVKIKEEEKLPWEDVTERLQTHFRRPYNKYTVKNVYFKLQRNRKQ
ncbi:MAG: hypothetical protein Q9168_001734 [Polycauliona sp. 1 TL-2023]